MGYTVNPAAFVSAFMVPRAVADKHIKLATDRQLRVLLCVLKDMHEQIDASKIAQTLALPESEVCDCLTYWAQNGILNCDDITPEVQKATVVKKDSLPTRTDVAARGLEDPKVAMLLREAQLKFGRNLKTNESGVLVWMYDDLGLDVSVILMLLQYALAEKKCNITFIQKTAVSWSEAGVENVADAERLIAETLIKQLAWNRVCSAFGIERRKPSERETELSAMWIDDWKLDDSLLKLAYDACVDSKSKFNFAYTAKIIESWHQKKCKTAQDVKKYLEQNKPKGKTAPTKNDFAAYDLDLFEKMLNED